jgi:hypothetical protein
MKNALLLFFFFALVACTSNYKFQPTNSDSEPYSLVYTHGIPTLQKSIGDIYFDMDMIKGYRNAIKLRLFISNNSDKNLTFDPNQLVAYGMKSNGTGKKLKTYSADGYKRHVRNQNLLLAATLIAATATAAHTISPNEDQYCTNNGVYLIPTPFYCVENAVFASETNLQRPTDGLLRIHTIKPGEALEGNIMIGLNKAFSDQIILKYPFQDSIYHFNFERK